MKFQFSFFLLVCSFQLFSQSSAEPERVLDFAVRENGSQLSFSPIMPPLIQKPGAPKAYWSYFWEFGDGSFSREENPKHTYAAAGDFTVSLDAIAHYDDGKKVKKKKKPVRAGDSAMVDAGSPMNDVFDPKAKQMLALYSYSKPRAEEEITLVISYRNLGIVNTDGRLHLFFNEKKFPNAHFSFVEARVHHGEVVDNSVSDATPNQTSPMFDWATLDPTHGAGDVSLVNPDPGSATIIQQMLNNARGAYREEHAWRFNNLEAGEKRNVFVSLAGTPNMLRDTNAFIHLEAVFAPFDPVVAPERFEYQIEIVGSHDPNAIAVSDNLVNYRIVGSKKLDYKIQFQNNGEGPASKVEVKVEVPKGLKMNAMRPVDWYPKCPICPKTPTNRGCLDTLTLDDGFLFTFRNIYLPGSRQDDVDNRDSTKGFVKYNIESSRNMPKLPFRSRARIVFDKNPPIYTNYTRTRFKVGLSPGLKAGYAFRPDSAANGYAFIGFSLSPYKSWRVYPQVELLTGLKGRDSFESDTSFIEGVGTTPGTEIDTFSSVRLQRKHERGFISFEVPVLIRKNFNRFFGAGIGGSVRVVLDNGKDVITRYQTDYQRILQEPPTLIKTLEPATTSEPYKKTSFGYSLFADLTLGAVRVGPNLGVRAGYILGQGRQQPFVQVSAELKL
ncbi:MAG: PKD domain-containing protein [Saprospiraceae bacterium]|nr:PKD domain-containing protein [Saprospiraceae bacterium]